MTILKKYAFQALIFLSGAGLILFTGLFLCLEHPYVHGQIEKRISAAIPGRISWEDISISLPRGMLNLEGFRLSGVDNTEILYLQDLSIWMDLPAVLRKHFVFPRISVNGLRCTLSVDRLGNLNLVSAVIPPEEKKAPTDTGTDGPKFPIAIEQFEIADGTLAFTFQDRSSAVLMSGLSVLVNDADLLRKKGDLTLKLNHTEIQNDADTVSFGPVTLKAGMDGQNLAIRSFGLKSGFLDAVLQGRITDLLNAPVFDLALSADARPEKLPQHIREAVPADLPAATGR